MSYNPLIHHRRSIRLQGYDYSQEGMYYVTLTTQDRAQLFGVIKKGEMHLSEIGAIIDEEWLRTPIIRPEVSLDEYIIMPDHMHVIIVINEERNGVTESMNNLVGAYSDTPERVTPFRSPSQSLGAIIRGFKGASTRRINALRGTSGERVWQRNYYEHIIRDGDDLDRIRAYIANNPDKWAERDDLKMNQ